MVSHQSGPLHWCLRWNLGSAAATSSPDCPFSEDDESNDTFLSSQCCSKSNRYKSDLSPSSWCHTSESRCTESCRAMWICPGGAMKSETESFGAFTTPTAKPPTAKPPTAKPPTARIFTVEPPTAKPPTFKPPTAKPPTARIFTAKTPTNTPPTQKPPTQKPPTQKPPTAKPPTAKPPTATPPTTVTAKSKPCVCKESWTYDDTGCRAPINGCPAEPCDGWDEGTWCVVEDDDCDTADGSGDEAWSFCTPPPGAVSIKQQPRSQNICKCKRYWTSDDGGRCGSTQYGCPSTACDDDSPDSWCIVEDPNCESAELDNGVTWSYCDPDACVCKDRWTNNDDDGCKTDQYGCPVEACDGYHKTWCVVEDGNCATAEEEDGVKWSYCGTGLEEDNLLYGSDWWSG